MIDKLKVLHTFCTYSGLDRNESLKYDQIIRIAISEITAKLRPDADFEQNRELIQYLCGITAYYRYVLLLQNDFSEMKMGNVTVKKYDNDHANQAKLLLNDAVALACSILIDDYYFSIIN